MAMLFIKTIKWAERTESNREAGRSRPIDQSQKGGDDMEVDVEVAPFDFEGGCFLWRPSNS